VKQNLIDNIAELKSLSNLKAQLSTSSNNNALQIEDEIHKIKAKNREMKRSYLSTISTKYNPDILVGEAVAKGIGFIRGNEYFA